MKTGNRKQSAGNGLNLSRFSLLKIGVTFIVGAQKKIVLGPENINVSVIALGLR